MRTFSLKTQISGVIILSTTVLLVAIGTLQVKVHIQDMEEDESRFLTDMMRNASAIAYVVVPHFVDNDFAYMDRLVAHLGKNPYSMYVSIVDTQNRVMAKSDGMALGSTLKIPPPQETITIGEGAVRKYFRGGEEYFDISYPIKAGDLVLGAVRIGLNNEWLKEERSRLQTMLLIDIAVAVFIVIGGVFLSSWLVHKFVVPVLHLKQAAEKVGKGDYSQSVEVKNRDEVGILAGSFNEMVGALRNASAQLVEKKYVDSIIASMHDALIVLTPDGRIRTVNKTTAVLTGYAEDELLNKPAGMLFGESSDDSEALSGLKKRGSLSNIEKNIITKDGRKIPVLLSCSVINTEDAVQWCVCVAKDITERKHAEGTLKKALAMANEEKAKSEAVIAAIGDQMVILDAEFNIIYENDYAVASIGSYIGRKCYQGYENRDAVCDNCPVALSFQDGLIHRGERIAETVIGTMHLDMCASPLKDASGRVVAVIEMVRDISDRKKVEAALRKSHEKLEKQVTKRTAELTLLNEQLRHFAHNLQEAREQERTIIAREIHDELGQSLTALKMDLSILARRLSKGERKIVAKTESMAALIETTIQNVKRISTELRPGILDHLGLTAALDWQAKEFEKRTGIFCDVTCEPEEIVVDRGRSTAVFRIFQETLTNVARHANASKVSVLLNREDGGLVLRVKDDGDGITKDQSSDTRSLGIIGMRERVHYWGGSLVISGIRNKGTTIVARIPLGAAGEKV